MRRDASGNAVLPVWIEHGVVFVALVQGVIGAFNENFGPFHKGSGQETSKGADQHFLKKRGVHPIPQSSHNAINPTLCGRNPA